MEAFSVAINQKINLFPFFFLRNRTLLTQTPKSESLIAFTYPEETIGSTQAVLTPKPPSFSA
jgi:hypothetical protein